MNMDKFYNNTEERPLDNITPDGGLSAIFRTICCVGDSLSSGEFESLDENGNKGYHDYFEYSWGQYMARHIGAKVYNFSRGGMTARESGKSYGNLKGFWNPDFSSQAYIIALGVNDMNVVNCAENDLEFGSIADIDLNDWKNNKKTFAGYYAQIIQRYKEIQPKAKFFLMTMPNDEPNNDEHVKNWKMHADLLYELADMFDNTYVIDLFKYAPVYDDTFKKHFFLSGHMSAAGYVFTARMVESYLDYIIRHNPDDFRQIGFVGTPFHNTDYKW